MDKQKLLDCARMFCLRNTSTLGVHAAIQLLPQLRSGYARKGWCERMNYGRAIVICKNLTEEHSESEFIEAVGTILDMATINAVPKEALLNVVRYFWAHCVEQVEQVENGEAEEYICRETLIERIRGTGYTDAIKENLIFMVLHTPAADVRPVVKGRWLYDCDRVAADGWTYKQRHCSECGRQTLESDNFCPNCGADMRGGHKPQ